MSERTTITIERFRDTEGVPTCCRHVGDQQCQFVGTRNMGLITLDVCNLSGVELHHFGYRPGTTEWAAKGWLRPATGCPVWPEWPINQPAHESNS